MYLTRFEIITFATLISFLLLGGLATVLAFIGTSIYLHFFNRKIYYYLSHNEDVSAMMLEGGSRSKNNQMLKFAAIIGLWFAIWFLGGFQRQYVDTYLQNFLSFWTFIGLFASLIMTCYFGFNLLVTDANRAIFSKRELMLAGTLFIDLTVGIYYFYHWFSISDHSQILDQNMLKIVIQIIIFSAVAASVLSLMVYGNKAEQAKDERDSLIEVKSYKYGFCALASLIGLLIGQVIIDSLAIELWGDRALNLNTVEIVNLLLLFTIIAWAVVSSAQLLFYRRGY
ncbi:MAG: hypothetical protein COC24_017945 [Alphaproteobacteria bacterium]|nr:hypothetical protein [Alphaproteobacteria bacterium]